MIWALVNKGTQNREMGLEMEVLERANKNVKVVTDI